MIRYWLCPSIHSLVIRVAWDCGTTLGTVCEDGSVDWQYGVPPNEDLALECALSAGEWDVPGAEYGGNESLDDMEAAVESAVETRAYVALMAAESMHRVSPLTAATIIRRFRILERFRSRAGAGLRPVSVPGFGEGPVFTGPSADVVIERARQLGTVGALVALEIDSNDLPIERSAEMAS